ncbi:MAG: hypothetical protein Q4C81_05110 [Kocuria sp.]|nr:hypothetical protein [Kocuria sp.]
MIQSMISAAAAVLAGAGILSGPVQVGALPIAQNPVLGIVMITLGVLYAVAVIVRYVREKPQQRQDKK